MPGILVVEDDENLNRGITFSLKKSGYEVFSAESVKKAKRIASDNNVDVTICDVNLPDGNGLEFVRWMRCNYNTYIICLTALDQEMDQVMGYEAGADDYITKPFSIILLHKRIEALLRRGVKLEENRKWNYKDIEIDFEGYSAKKNDEIIDLKPKEIKLIELLLKYKGKVLSRAQILDNLWSIEECPNDRVIDVYIKNIRKKLSLDCIVTVKGIGYKFEEQ